MSDDIEARLKAAEAAVAELSSNFVEWIGDDMGKAKDSLKQSQADIDNCADNMLEFYNAIHNVKGLGGSFGYDLVTDVAESCCYLLKKTEQRNAVVLKLCQAHLSALDAIIDRNVKGDGGASGAAILTKLRDTVDATLTALEQGKI